MGCCWGGGGGGERDLPSFCGIVGPWSNTIVLNASLTIINMFSEFIQVVVI